MRDERDLRYSKTHEWVDMSDDNTAYIGIDDFAQSEMGDIVFINLPDVGDTVSDLISPVSGKVIEVNEELLDNPGLINEEPYEAWMIKVEDAQEADGLMDRAEMDSFIENEK